MRIGSALAPNLPLLAIRHPDLVGALNRLPSIIGDSIPDKAPGELWPGGEILLRGRIFPAVAGTIKRVKEYPFSYTRIRYKNDKI